MRLHRLTLRDVKGVRERTVELPDHGVVVIEGPNEVGKTTLLEAFDVLLSSKSTSKAAQVRALQPVDRDVGPFVEAELTVGRTRLRYAKQWLRQPSTTLQVLGERPEQLTGDAAQQRVDGLLKEHLDRTLWDALRLTQAGDGTVAPLMSSAVLTEALDAAAGAQQHAEGADSLLEEVDKEFARYFSPTGRPTGDYRAASTRWNDAQAAVAEAHRQVEEGRALLQRQEDARALVGTAERAAGEAAAQLAEAERSGAEVEAVASAHEAAAGRVRAAADLRRSAVAAQERRTGLVQESERLTDALAQTRAARESDLADAGRLGQALVEAQEAVELADERAEAAGEAVVAARSDLDRASDLRELEAQERLLERAEQLAAAVRAAREVQPAVPVARDLARRVRQLQDKVGTLEMEHLTASPQLEVVALDASVQVAVADGGRQLKIGPGQRELVTVVHDTTVEVPGQARVSVRLETKAMARVAELNRARRRVADALAGFGVEDVDALDALADATEQARERLRESVRDLEALLAPHGAALAAEAAASGTVPAALAERVHRLRALVPDRAAGPRTAGGDVAHTPALAPERDRPDVDSARDALAAASAAERTARQAQRTAAQQLSERRQAVAALTARIERAGGSIEAQETRLEEVVQELAAARAETPDEALAEAVTSREAELVAAEEAKELAAAAVAGAEVDGVRSTLASARHRSRLADQVRQEALAELHHLSGQVEMAAGEGRAERYDLAVADLEDAERALAAIDRRARAVRHLRDTLLRHRDAAHRAYVRPYTAALDELGRQVYGSGFAVVVDEQLGLESRTLDGATVPFAELSGGAKEQLGILARLAVARLVDPTQGVPVVIDDALGYSDPDRLRRMGEVLGSAGVADGLQVILLTCTPQRYAAVEGATTVRLTA